MPSNPQFRGVGARTKKTETPKGDTPPKGNTPPTTAPKKPSAKNDPRNAQYNKMRADLNATAFQSKKDKDGATKATEKIGKNAWAKANPAAAAAEKKRKASKNPLMKGFGDRDARKKELERIRGGAALKSIGSSKNADKILSGRSASKDAESIAKKSYNRVLTGNPDKGLDKPKAKTPQPDMRSTPPKGAPVFNVKPRVVTPASSRATGGAYSKPSAVKPGGNTYGIPSGAKPTVKVGDRVGYSKGGEVKKKTKKESFLGLSLIHI